MVFGLPQNEVDRPTFHFDKVVEYERHDREGSPFDYAAAPEAETQKSSVSPVCAFEFFSPLGRQGSHATEVGDFTPTTLLVTMLEDEWDEVKGFAHVTVGPSNQKWLFRYYRPSYALGEFTVYQVHCSAEGVE